MSNQDTIAELFRDGVPYAESLNSRLRQSFILLGASATAILDLFRDDANYAQSFNSRLRDAFQLVGGDGTELFRDNVAYQLTLYERLVSVFAGVASSYSPALNFDDARNSMYAFLLFAW